VSLEQSRVCPVAILGAGLAGLVAANYLLNHGIPVVVFESGEHVAGLATSFRDGDFIYDFGAHFITNRLAREIGIESQCRVVRHYGETVLLKGKYYGYPFGLLRNVRFLGSALQEKLRKSNRKPKNVGERFIDMYGPALASEVAIPLVESWSGASAALLAPSVADKIPLSVARVVFLRMMSVLMRRAIAIGYGKEKPSSVRVWHVHPEKGVASLCERLAQPLGDRLRLKSRVEEIVTRDGKVQEVRVNGEYQDVSAVVSTAPCNLLPKLVTGTDDLRYLSRFRYRPMLFVLLRMEGRKLLRDTVVWTPENKYAFFRLTEAPISMPWLAPAGKTLITVDIGCEVGDKFWRMADDELGRLCVEQLEGIVPGAKARFLGCRVLRTPFAYPVFLKEHEDDRTRFRSSTGIECLFSIGRNGEFDHLLTEDVYWRSISQMESAVPTIKSRIHERISSRVATLPV
jgi:protoporphyrinogen/coproporphyrinogen III oxidase